MKGASAWHKTGRCGQKVNCPRGAREAALPERERQVILLRYFRGMTQDRTAKVLGVSQVQVSRIERKAVEHLRRKLE